MMNGVVGLEPGYGAISTAGIYPLAPSMDTVGPMARTVADAVLAFDCLNAPRTAASPIVAPPRIGTLDQLWRGDQVPSPDVAQVMDQAVADLLRKAARWSSAA